MYAVRGSGGAIIRDRATSEIPQGPKQLGKDYHSTRNANDKATSLNLQGSYLGRPLGYLYSLLVALRDDVCLIITTDEQ